jgi:DNA-binding transcriptional LysR family regulator
MNGVTLHQLQCFDAVVVEGGFQAAAARLNRTHPSVFAAVKALETQLALKLFDRDGYRVELTDTGRDFHLRAKRLLQEADALGRHAAQLSMGEESDLTIVIGDLCPLHETLSLLREFSAACPQTRLHLHVENLSAPMARLTTGDADLMFHYVEEESVPLEQIAIGKVRLIPVVAPGFLRFPVSDRITPEEMRDYVQCVIRDTSENAPDRGYYLIDGARRWTVGDQMTKKEIILQGMGWGHMPAFLVENELKKRKLLSIAGRHFKGNEIPLVAARRRDEPHGPIAEKLWQFVAGRAKALSRAVRG